MSESVLRICNILDIDIGSSSDLSTQDRTRIVDRALTIWDGTHEDAEVVVELLRNIARVKGSPR